MKSGRVNLHKSAADYRLMKRLAVEDSEDEARRLVYRNQNLIRGASVDEICCVIEKITSTLLKPRLALLDAEIARRAVVSEFEFKECQDALTTIKTR